MWRAEEWLWEGFPWAGPGHSESCRPWHGPPRVRLLLSGACELPHAVRTRRQVWDCTAPCTLTTCVHMFYMCLMYFTLHIVYYCKAGTFSEVYSSRFSRFGQILEVFTSWNVLFWRVQGWFWTKLQNFNCKIFDFLRNYEIFFHKHFPLYGKLSAFR